MQLRNALDGFTSRLDEAEESVTWNTGSGTHRATKSKKSQRQDVVYVFEKVPGRQFRWCGLKEDITEVNEFHLEK